MAVEILAAIPEPDLAEVGDSEHQAKLSRLGQRNAVHGLLSPDGKCFVFHAFALVLVLAAPVTPE